MNIEILSLTKEAKVIIIEMSKMTEFKKKISMLYSALSSRNSTFRFYKRMNLCDILSWNHYFIEDIY